MIYRLEKFVNIKSVSRLLNSIYNISGIPIGIFNINGKPIYIIEWNDLCTKLNKINDKINKMCVKNMHIMLEDLNKNGYKRFIV
ncbi:PocR ligand-binding domain-containing protein [Caloramator sp. E03]|uniref:PocR ligand-binding domain-containing protein n=1 Tax=Caloramator sp. E03 TaxID=2576307 RepID=UPI00143DF7FB|nr:PocR ligand-binding domain-containing protein [Caloramator sp. E03]